MTRPAKKALERQYMQRVRELLADFPAATEQEHEQPDFLIPDAGRVVGIELTELYGETDNEPIPPQGREAMRDRVIQRAKMLYDSDGHPPIDCLVTLKDVSMRGSEVELLARSVVNLAVRNTPPDGELMRTEEYDWKNRNYFPEGVERIRVARYPSLVESFFGGTGSTWVVPLGVDHIMGVLAAKEASYDAYRLNCDEAWLVIAIDGHRMATWFDSVEAVRSAIFTTRFTRVLVLRNLSNELVELRTKLP